MELTEDQCTDTTADDERNYFFGDTQQAPTAPGPQLPPGSYRVIDGVLCRIISGLSVKEVRDRVLATAAKEPSDQ